MINIKDTYCIDISWIDEKIKDLKATILTLKKVKAQLKPITPLIEDVFNNIGFVETTSEKLNSEDYKPYITDEDGGLWTITNKEDYINTIKFTK